VRIVTEYRILYSVDVVMYMHCLKILSKYWKVTMAIFRFFKIAAAAMLDFWNYKVLTVGRIISAELRHHAKFRGDWSNSCRDISIFDFSRWWQPQSWIFKILFVTIRTVKKDELRHCAKFCWNRSNHGVGDMSVFDFSRWRPPPSWICKILNF